MHSDEAKASRYTDTFGRHEADLSSDGRPWRLVRDVGVGSFDEPQDETTRHDAERVEHLSARRADELRRAESVASGEPFDNAVTSSSAFGGSAKPTRTGEMRVILLR